VSNTYRFLVAAMPAPGHVAPLAPVVRALIAKGHEVLWYGSRHYEGTIRATGADFAPIERILDFGDGDVEAHFPERKNYQGLEQVKFDFKHVFIDSIPGMLADLEALHDQFQADVLLTDPTVVAARYLSQKRNLPWAIMNITVMAFPGPDAAPFGLGIPASSSPLGRLRNRILRLLASRVLFREVQEHFDKLSDAQGWARRPFEFDVSPYLVMQPAVPEFEYPRTDIPPQVHYIGSVMPESDKGFNPPDWWGEVVVKKRPLVLVTQGTVANLTPELIQPTLDGLANEDVTVIATTGGKTAEEMGIRVPKNAHVVPFVPYTRLMPHVDAMVTNGGYGGVMIALTHGVPLVIGGTTEDKTEVSARVAYTGVGINLKTSTPAPEKVRDAVRRVLGEESYRQKAGMVQAALSGKDARKTAVALLERLATTRQPVTTQGIV
jgi:MGT family glycosyltransferase